MTRILPSDTMGSQLEEYSSTKLWTLRHARTTVERPRIIWVRGLSRFTLLNQSGDKLTKDESHCLNLKMIDELGSYMGTICPNVLISYRNY